MRFCFTLALLLLPGHALLASATYGTLYGGTTRTLVSRLPLDRDIITAREVVVQRGPLELHLAMFGRVHPSVPLSDYESHLDALKRALASATEPRPLQLISSPLRRGAINAVHCAAEFVGLVAMVPVGLGILIGPSRGSGDVGAALLLGGGAVCVGAVAACGLANQAFYGDLSRALTSVLTQAPTASGALHFVYAPPSDGSDMLEFGDLPRALVRTLKKAGFATTADEATEL